MVRIPTHRKPSHPGEVMLEEFLKPLGLTQRKLADGIEVPYRHVNELVNGKRDLTPYIALRLAQFLGTTPGVWTNLQLAWDLYHAKLDKADVLGRIKPTRFTR